MQKVLLKVVELKGDAYWILMSLREWRVLRWGFFNQSHQISKSIHIPVHTICTNTTVKYHQSAPLSSVLER